MLTCKLAGERMVEKENGDYSEIDEDVEAVLYNIKNNFDDIPGDLRNELLLKLSRKEGVAGAVVLIVANNFDKLPDAVRDELLLNLSKYDISARDVARIITSNFNKLPENVRDILFQMYNNYKAAADVVRAVVDNFDKLPQNVRIVLLIKIYEKYEGKLPIFYKLPLYVRNKLPENIRDPIARKDSWSYKHPALGENGEEHGEPEIKAAKPEASETAEPPVPVEPPLRYADFAFNYDEGNKRGQKVPDGHTLQAGQWYQLEVAVCVKPTGIPFEGEKRESIKEPKQEQPVTIMVTAEAEDEGFIEIEEPTREIILPPYGDSTENALFRVRPLRQSASINDIAQIRIRLYYEFNLIEVAKINVEVVGKFDNPARSQLGLSKPIWFEQERRELEYQNLDTIMPRDLHIDINKKGDRFLFTFAFYKSPDQKMVLTASAHLPAAYLEDILMNVRRIWYDIAMSRTFTEQLEGEKDEFVASVRRLAKAGQNLWTKLFMLEKESSIYKIGQWLKSHPIKPGGIIQVSLHKDAASFVFPWALIYYKDIPRKEYELPDINGFWGLQYCIEQQLPNRNKGTDKPVQIPDKLKLGFMLWEEFRNADKEISLMENLKARSAGRLEVTPPITDADDCIDLMSNCDAHVLYFYTHGYTRHHLADIGVGLNLDLFIRRYENLDENSPLRETYRLLYESIKQNKFEPDSSWIELTNGKLYLEELYYKIKELQSHPFVILNMCESAQVTPSLSDSFIHFFLISGANGVIGTECPMTVEFAHPFAEKFLGDMLAGEQAGRVLLNVRRYFIDLKNPLGLAYTLFGSVSVRFEPPRF